MYDRLQQHASKASDPAYSHRRLTWRGVTASLLLIAAVAAISYPLVTTLLVPAVTVAVGDHALQARDDSRTKPRPSTILAATTTVANRD